jgi:hypothetical protein
MKDTVFILDHEPTGQPEPVFHTSEDCPMVAYERKQGNDCFVEVPRWIIERAGLRQCQTFGACREEG